MSEQPRKNSWFRSGLNRVAQVLWPVALFLANGCYSDYYGDELRQLRSQLAEQRSADSSLEGRVRSIEAFLTYCPDEVRRLIGMVEKECNSEEFCAPEGVKLMVLDVARWNGGRFLPLMQDRKHVALFLPPEGRELREVERKQLRDLIEPAWLDDQDRRTRLLVVSHPVGTDAAAKGQAKKRGDYVIREMMSIVGKLHPSAVVPDAAPPPQTSPLSRPPSLPVSRVLLSSMPGGNLYSLPASQSSGGLDMKPVPPLSGAAEPNQTPAAPRQRYILHWVFPFSRDGEVLRPEDRPPKPELIKSSVFVYRVEC